MARLIDRLRRPGADRLRFGLGDLAAQVEALQYAGHQYLLLGGRMGYQRLEEVRISSEGVAYASNGVVFSVVSRRIDLFSQASFAWRNPDAGPKAMASDLFRDAALAPLATPEDLLGRMQWDQAVAGNSFIVRDGDTLRTLVPWWVGIVLTSERFPEAPEQAWDQRVGGYLYRPPGGPEEVFLPPEVAHFRGKPDPDARFRGMSYLRPILRNVGNVEAYERFLSAYWTNGATPNLAVVFDKDVKGPAAEEWRDRFLEDHRGAEKAFETAFIGGGADLKVVGANLKDLEASEVNAAEYANICNAAGVPVVVSGIVPGLENAATYANYGHAMRAFADVTVRPDWARACRALGGIVGPPLAGRAGALWYDVSGVSALQEDAKDDAAVQNMNALTIKALVEAGCSWDAAVEATITGDTGKLLGAHSGLFSVQLQPPGGAQPEDEADEPAEAPTEPQELAVAGGARVLQQIYLPVKEGILTEDEAREMANRAGAGLVGPAPEKDEPTPPPFPPPFPGGPAAPDPDDPDDPDDPEADQLDEAAA